ncbi:MAG: site-specific DNA-methyltransferase [Leeuwenhoekiella sp.]|nr:MAG: site-specific DNA-methyltransferase [Leeuwenhoekiella sp.]
MDGRSLTPQEIKLQELKTIFPEVFAEGKVDWEKLKATLGEDINFSNERYVLNWAGKSDAFKVLQTPTSKTLIPAKEESVNFDETENIFIEGENLEVLKVLQKSYFGKIKMIYIDPPYNTGNDHFIYPDKFSETKDEYEKRVGDKDEEGYMTKDGMFKKNSKENGQYHSNWMNMMYPRLFLAKNLLKQDGVIFISIDDNEVHNLIMIMNEVFGEENFISNVTVINNFKGRSDDKFIATATENLLIYHKGNFTTNGVPIPADYIAEYKLEEAGRKYRHIGLRKRGSNSRRVDRPNMYYPIYYNPDNASISLKRENDNYIEILPRLSDGEDGCWRWGKNTVEDRIKELEAKFISIRNEYDIFQKDFLYDDKGIIKRVKPKSFWMGPEFSTEAGTIEYKKLFGSKAFENPKPLGIILNCLYQAISEDDDIILDFFAGSSTTGQSVFQFNKDSKLNAKFILVQLPCKIDENHIAYKKGYKNLSEIGKERLRRVLKQITEDSAKYDGDLGFKVFKLSDSNFKQWQQIKNKDAKALEEQMKLFVDPVAETATIENMVYELMLKSGKDLNSKITNENGFYAINDNELIFLLNKAEQKIIDSIISAKPKKVVALDKLFKDNDQLKTNTVLQMKDAGIEFKTI